MASPELGLYSPAPHWINSPNFILSSRPSWNLDASLGWMPSLLGPPALPTEAAIQRQIISYRVSSLLLAWIFFLINKVDL